MSNKKKQDDIFSGLKKEAQKIGEKSVEIVNGIKEKTGKFLKGVKKGFKNTVEKIDITIKEKQMKWLKKETKKWKAHPQVLAMKDIMNKSVGDVKSDTSQIKKDTSEIKGDVAQIKEELKQIISTLEILDYKSDKIDNYLEQIIPKLELILDDIKDLEEYIKERIGSKWSKLKKYWKKYQEGEISRATFIKYGFKTLGITFVKIFKGKI